MTTEEILQDLEQTKTDVMHLEAVCQNLQAFISNSGDEDRSGLVVGLMGFNAILPRKSGSRTRAQQAVGGR